MLQHILSEELRHDYERCLQRREMGDFEYTLYRAAQTLEDARDQLYSYKGRDSVLEHHAVRVEGDLQKHAWVQPLRFLSTPLSVVFDGRYRDAGITTSGAGRWRDLHLAAFDLEVRIWNLWRGHG